MALPILGSTKRPLMLGALVKGELLNGGSSFSVDVLNDSTSNEDLKPEVNFVHSSNFGNFGFAISGSFQDRNNIEEGTRESNWLSVEDMAAIEGYSRVDKNAAGITTDGGTKIVPELLEGSSIFTQG